MRLKEPLDGRSILCRQGGVRLPFEKIRGGYAKSMGDVLQPPGADTVLAILIFPKFLARDAEALAESFRAEADDASLESDFHPDVSVDTVRRFRRHHQ
nr:MULTISPECIES: hypothetical protein [unclassified Microvirga]